MAVGNKTGGRKAGTPNKMTSSVRDAIYTIVNQELETLGDTLSALPPSERIQAVIKLLAYIVPKPLQKFESDMGDNIEVTLDIGNTPTAKKGLEQILNGL